MSTKKLEVYLQNMKSLDIKEAWMNLSIQNKFS